MIGVGMIAIAMALAFGAWCRRSVQLAKIAEERAAREAAAKEKRDEQTRLNASFDSIQKLILQWTKIREAAETPAQPPFHAEGDNFTTIADPDNLVHFGKKPSPTPPEGAA